MHHGRISMEGEADQEIDVSPRPRSRKKHGNRSNAYSTRGLDKFENVYSKLSSRREYIVNKIGAPEALVRFKDWKDGWVPVVVGDRDGILKKNEVSIPEPMENNGGDQKGTDLERRDERNDINGECESSSDSESDERSYSPVMPWSPFLKNTALEGWAFCAMWVRKSVVTAAAVMAVGVGTCMKNFILNGVSNLAGYSRNPEASQNGGDDEAIAEQEDVGKVTRRTPSPGLSVSVSVPSRPLRDHVELSAITLPPRAVKPQNMDSDQHNHGPHHQSKAKKIRRVVAVDNRPTRPGREVQGSYRRTSQAMDYDTSMGPTVFIIMLFSLVVSGGRLCAIFFTSAWWYLLPILRKYQRNQKKSEQESG